MPTPEAVTAETAVDEVPTPPVVVATPGSAEAASGIGEISTRLASLTADYQCGSVDCSTAMAQVDQCVQTLDTQYLGCDSMPAWQDCRNQCVEFQSTLPCCEETVISDVLISEEIIGEQIIEPIPMAEACLPACEGAPFSDYGSCGGGCGFGGGGGGGGFGGGGLLGAGLGAAALAVGLADDDGGRRAYDGT
jgi:uncharacterized membrane protein YgcG